MGGKSVPVNTATSRAFRRSTPELADRACIVHALSLMTERAPRRVEVCDDRPIPDYPVNFNPGYRVITTLYGTKSAACALRGKDRDLELEPGDFLVSRPHSWVLERWDSAHTHAAIVFHNDFVRLLLIETSGRSVAGHPVGERVHFHTARPADPAVAHLLRALSGSPPVARARQNLLAALLELVRAQVESDRPNETNHASFRWQLVRTHIVENIETPIRRHDVALAAGVSVGYLSRLVREHSGRSFAEYVAELRLERATHLLNDTAYSVREIAALVGYNDQDTFIRNFRRHYGTTPGRYRSAG